MEPDVEQYPDLVFATLDLDGETAAEDPRVAGTVESIARGFHLGRTSAEFREHWLEHVRRDRVTVRGVWQREPRLGSGAMPVATFVGFDKTLNVGGRDPLPFHMITDVTVSPTQRRRGLLRALMTTDLREAADAGLPLAGLTVSEGSIYGRFGFGLATTQHQVEVETTSRFALRDPLRQGHLELVEPQEAWPTVEAVFGRFHASTRGSVDRTHFHALRLVGEFDFMEQKGDEKLRATVSVDADGEPDGYVLWRPAGRVDGISTADVVDLVALTDDAHLRLWRFLADIDLVQRVRHRSARPDDLLPWALTDPRVHRTVGSHDLLWLRVLDVAAALQGREWAADGAVTLQVADPMGYADGCFAVRTSGGHAEVRPAARDDLAVRLSVDTLGALYLGGVGVQTLAAAGRITGDDHAVETFAAMADLRPAPYCITDF